jgi:hypothetical protein
MYVRVHINTTLQVFYDEPAFNQDLSAWNVARVSCFDQMFNAATAFSGCNQRRVYDAWGATFKAAYPSFYTGSCLFATDFSPSQSSAWVSAISTRAPRRTSRASRARRRRGRQLRSSSAPRPRRPSPAVRCRRRDPPRALTTVMPMLQVVPGARRGSRSTPTPRAVLSPSMVRCCATPPACLATPCGVLPVQHPS